MKHRHSSEQEELMLRKFVDFLEEEGVLFPTSEKTVAAYLAKHKDEFVAPDHLPEPMELVRQARARREAKREK